jgi:polysaccharide export outer membrane protein
MTTPTFSSRRFAALALAALVAPAAAVAAGQDATRSSARSGATAPSAPGAPAVDAGYRLGPEDVLEVFVWKEPELSTSATVRPDGRISMPLVGEIVAAGKTPAELQSEIAAGLGEYLSGPVVTVVVREVNSPQVSVLGEVRRPGRYRIAQSATILDAIALGGGFTDFARRRHVVVLRPGPRGVERIRVDVTRVLRDADVPLALRPGDTVYVD